MSDDEYQEVLEMSRNVSAISKKSTIESFPQEVQPLNFEPMSPNLDIRKFSLSLDIIMSIMDKVDKFELDYKDQKALNLLENLIEVLESSITLDKGTKQMKARLYERMGKLSSRLKIPAKALKYSQKDLEISTSLRVSALICVILMHSAIIVYAYIIFSFIRITPLEPML